jgi:hypothetical protein
MEPGHNGNLCLAETFYSPEDLETRQSNFQVAT